MERFGNEGVERRCGTHFGSVVGRKEKEILEHVQAGV